MSAERRQIERWIGAVLVPEVRVAGTIASASEVLPSREYLERFPPAGVVAFGRTPNGAVSPTPQIERVRAMCSELGNPRPFVACDLEQGAGLHFTEGIRLPPALALASTSLAEGGWAHYESDVVTVTPLFHAGLITATEARRFGVDVVLAPVCDVNTRGDNPIISVRSYGDEPHAAARRAFDFYTGLMLGGVTGCAKHFPGHGDTAQDSHLELPRIERDARGLREVELVPFRKLALLVDAVMVAHLDVPALTGEPGLPCTLSQRAIEGVLRDEVQFRGVVLSDAMNMHALDRQPERYVRALEAGCEGLLCPHDPFAAAAELLTAVESGRVPTARLRSAAERMSELPKRAPSLMPQGRNLMRSTPQRLAETLADRALRCSRDEWPWPRDRGCELLEPLPRSESPEIVAGLAGLREACLSTRGRGRELTPVVCELRAFTGRYGLDPDELAELDRHVAAASASEPLAIAWFGSPQALPKRLWHDPRAAILLAFAPTPPMFEAVARFLSGGPLATGSLPTELG